MLALWEYFWNSADWVPAPPPTAGDTTTMVIGTDPMQLLPGEIVIGRDE